jgi:hypothetical protein
MAHPATTGFTLNEEKTNSLSSATLNNPITTNNMESSGETFIQVVFVIDSTASQKPHAETIQKIVSTLLRFFSFALHLLLLRDLSDQ